MNEQVAAYADPLITWLQTTGVDIGLKVVFALAILAVGGVAIRLLSVALAKALAKTKLGQKSLIAKFVVSVIVKAAWALLIVIALGKIGVDVGPLIAGLGVTGFILGFAFQESLGSLAAGLMIAFNQPFKVGDYVQVAGFEGSITALDMMAVVLSTADNRRITIPNKQAWGSPIVNYSAQDKRRVDVSVGIAYGADIALARQTALAAIKAVPGVLADPAPLAEVIGLGDSAVMLTVRAWAKTADYWSVFFAGNRLVKESFDKAGVPIPFPQLDVHVIDKAKASVN